MASAERNANINWEGNLAQGNGVFTVGSGALGEMPVTWASRSESPGGKTSPEELIAAAHASCYAMALSNVLGEGGNDPQQLNVGATCTLDLDNLKVSTMQLDVRATVPGLDESGLQQAIETANQVCPVSNALRGNVDINVNANLA